MAPIPGFKAKILKSGVSTSFTDEPMTNSGTNEYTITDSTKAVWDRSATFTFSEDDGSGGRLTIPSSDIQDIDYLFGVVTFTRAVTAPVQVSGKYLPMATVASVNNFSLSMSHTILDASEIGVSDPAYRKKVYGLIDANITLGKFSETTDDFFTIFSDEDPVVIELQPDLNGSEKIRGWFIVESDNYSGSVDDLENIEVTLQLEDDRKSAFSWR